MIIYPVLTYLQIKVIQNWYQKESQVILYNAFTEY